MDPDACLVQLEEQFATVLENDGWNRADIIDSLDALADKTLNLANWLRWGGFMPERWTT